MKAATFFTAINTILASSYKHVNHASMMLVIC